MAKCSLLSWISCHYGLRWFIFRWYIWVKSSLCLYLFDPRLAKQLQHLINVFGGMYDHVCLCTCMHTCMRLCVFVCVCVLECVSESEIERGKRKWECILKPHNTPGQCHSLCKPNSFSEDWGCIQGPIVSWLRLIIPRGGTRKRDVKLYNSPFI